MDDAVTFHWPGEPRNVPNHFPEFIVNSLTIQCLAQEVCTWLSDGVPLHHLRMALGDAEQGACGAFGMAVDLVAGRHRHGLPRDAAATFVAGRAESGAGCNN